MVGLVYIAPEIECVEVQASPVSGHGISAKGLAGLLARYSELRMLRTGKEVGTDQLPAMGADAVAAIIAAGCGYPASTVWEMTPRQIAGALYFARRRKQREAVERARHCNTRWAVNRAK